MSLVTGLFFLILLLNQRWSPPLKLQASHCSTFHIMCDVPSTAVFCSESIECFPGTASKFFLKNIIFIIIIIITWLLIGRINKQELNSTELNWFELLLLWQYNWLFSSASLNIIWAEVHNFILVKILSARMVTFASTILWIHKYWTPTYKTSSPSRPGVSDL